MLSTLVSGCLKTPQERWQEARNSSATECRKIGYDVGSVAYKQCIERGIDDKRKAHRRAVERLSDEYNRRTKVTTCTTNRYGNQATTTCH